MRIRIVFLTAILLVLSGIILADQPDVKKITRPENIPSFLGYVPGELIVQFRMPIEEIRATKSRAGYLSLNMFSLDAIAEKYEVTAMHQVFPGAKPTVKNGHAMDLSRYHKVRFDPTADLDEVMNAYQSDPNVESVEKNGIHSMYATPNDFYYSYQWHLNQANDHDIDAPEAWDLQTGDPSVIVAILDSGTRYYHPDLGGVNASPSNPGASRGNMWINTTELNGSSGVDDDGNGYVDDWIGWDFIQSTTSCWSGEDCGTEDNDPRDFNGHGTHTAGIFGMITNDDYGMCGVAGGWSNGTQGEYGNGTGIMALRMGYSYNYLGQEYGVVLMDAAAGAFYYAADNGAKIASCSWGSSNSGGIGAAATYFINSGGIIVVAAGNDGAEVSPDYLNGRGDCISVSATDENDNGASFTTYGTWVDICAPGNNIYSTFHDHADPNTNYWAAMGGTSMATPMVAGVCALIWAHNPGWSASQVENQLYASVDNIDAYLSSQYIGKMGAGRINAYNAVNTGTPPPTAAFVGSPTSGCVPLNVNFTNQSTGDITSWLWDFGDTQTSTQQNPSHTYTAAGIYTVTLTVTGPGGSDDEIKTNYITVNEAPTAGFVGSPTSGDAPLNVNFTNQSSGATSYLWNFGDTQTSTATNPSHTYTSAGTYTVTLTATNACGSDDEVKTDYITVTCTPPVAGFIGSPTSGDAPLTVNFTDQSTGATSWSWDFGDGIGTSTQQNPDYTYTSTGTYTVSLTVTNPCGNDTDTKTDYITVTCTAPVADFFGSPTLGDAPLLVDFTDLSSGNPTSWSWDFGDGVGSSTAQNPSYTYNNVGIYTVTLTATNSCGSDPEVKTNYITVEEPSSGYATLPYSTGFESGAFDEYWFTQSSNSEGRILITSANSPRGSYHLTMDDNLNGGLYAQNEAWLHVDLAGKADVELSFWWKEFSDEDHTQDGVFFSDNGGSAFTKVYNLTGGSTTYQNIILDVDALASANGLSLTGTFVIKFQQYDNYGITTDGMAFDDVSVTSLDIPPVADFVGNPTSGDIPLTVNFTDQSTNATSWLWDFGDGVGTSTQQNPNYTYTSTGSYTVTLTATNAFGSDQEVKTNYITTTCTAPVANFSGSPTSGNAPLLVDFTDLSSGNPTSWSWEFGDGVGTSTAQNPSYTYNDVGTYTVTLTATNSCGSDGETKTNYITVTEPSGDYANLPYSTGFEIGSFDQYWSTAEGVEGRIMITSGNGPHSGSYHMTMDDDYSGGSYSQNEAWLHVNLAGKTNVDLKFWWKEWSDETHTQDGVYFSDNGGSSFTKVFNLSGANTTWRQESLDVDALAAANGLSLTGTFVIKFQQYDNYPITSDGMAFDDISVTEASSTGYATLPYSTGFESGAVDEFWTIVEGVEGRILVTTANTPHSGSYHLTMDDDYSGGSYSQNEGWLKVDLSGYANVSLSFWWKEYSDETHTQDGVFFSDNGGSSFTKVYNLSGGTTTWQQINLDVDNLCSTYGLNLTGTFVIKFQQYDNYPISSDGFCFDDISVTGIAKSATGGPQAFLSKLIPTEFELSQNYPNPFNPNTTIKYAVPREAHVTLDIFNVLGQVVTTLVDEAKSTGFYSVEWDGRDHQGQSVASGIYIYRITSDDFIETKRMVLLK